MATTPTNIPLIPAPTDYTAADFDACLVAVQNAMSTAFPQWTDYNRAAAGNNVLRAFCHLADIVTKYQNDQGREAGWATVKRRRNAIALGRGVGIRLKGISAATVDLTFSIPAALTRDVLIPRGTRVSTSGQETALEFFTTADARILAGATSVIVSARNAKPRAETLTSTGLPDQRLPTAFLGFVEGSAVVTIASDICVPVSNFFASGPTSKHYMVLVDEEDRFSPLFGNGTNGAVPAVGDVDIAYETGGGAGGNAGVGTIDALVSTLFDTGGNAINASVTNVSAAAGGSDRETVEQARRRVPGAIRALTRTVAREDFEIVALGVPGVARSMMLTTDEDATVLDNHGQLVIVPVGGGAPSTTLKDQVKAEVTTVFPTMLTFKVDMTDPTYLTVNVSCQVKKRPNFTNTQVEANITAALTAFFAIQDADGAPNPAIDFGQNLTDGLLAWSDIFAAVRGATGVQRVEEDTFVPADDVVVTKKQFPVLGTVTVTFL